MKIFSVVTLFTLFALSKAQPWYDPETSPSNNEPVASILAQTKMGMDDPSWCYSQFTNCQSCLRGGCRFTGGFCAPTCEIKGAPCYDRWTFPKLNVKQTCQRIKKQNNGVQLYKGDIEESYNNRDDDAGLPYVEKGIPSDSDLPSPTLKTNAETVSVNTKTIPTKNDEPVPSILPQTKMGMDDPSWCYSQFNNCQSCLRGGCRFTGGFCAPTCEIKGAPCYDRWTFPRLNVKQTCRRIRKQNNGVQLYEGENEGNNNNWDDDAVHPYVEKGIPSDNDLPSPSLQTKTNALNVQNNNSYDESIPSIQPGEDCDNDDDILDVEKGISSDNNLALPTLKSEAKTLNVESNTVPINDDKPTPAILAQTKAINHKCYVLNDCQSCLRQGCKFTGSYCTAVCDKGLPCYTRNMFPKLNVKQACQRIKKQNTATILNEGVNEWNENNWDGQAGFPDLDKGIPSEPSLSLLKQAESLNVEEPAVPSGGLRGRKQMNNVNSFDG